ncbi:MAG: RNA polymerase sigma factor [Armatimonadota bacterium]
MSADLQRDEDAVLVDLHRRGDPTAFNALFRKYQRRVYALCYHILGSAEDAEDACQEAFVKAHRGLRSFRGDSRFSTWLTRIAVNVCRSETRRFWRRNVSSLDDPNLPMPSEHRADVSQELMLDVERSEVRRIVASLPERFRIALVLRHFEEMSYDEIAETMGWTLPQTKATIFRARQAFKQRYETTLREQVDV